MFPGSTPLSVMWSENRSPEAWNTKISEDLAVIQSCPPGQIDLSGWVGGVFRTSEDKQESILGTLTTRTTCPSEHRSG